MASHSFKNRILISFFAVIGVLALLAGALGFYIIQREIIQKEKNEVKEGLMAARYEYVGKIAKIRNGLDLVSRGDDLAKMRDKMRLDYLYFVPAEKKSSVRSEIAVRAFGGVRLGGTRLIGAEELAEMGSGMKKSVEIEIKPTPKARPSDKKVLEGAMAIEYAMPVDSLYWGGEGVLYGGRIINNDFPMVDKIRDLAFGNKVYDSKPTGTVTIFQDDVRIATNVLDRSGERAVGTRVSEKVYDTVVLEGKKWWDRAFVVTDWYFTAYEPIRDINGGIIGILYVGILEKPYIDAVRDISLVFLAITAGAMVLAFFLAVLLTGAITKHVDEVVAAADMVSDGKLGIKVNTSTAIKELDHLARSFNNMASNLKQSHSMMSSSNTKLTELNKTYLDLVGFVSHELKGILSSTTLNAYSLRDGFLGMVNFKQRKALDSVTRNLDYLASTVKNFLNLSRIEKGETSLNRTEISLKEDIFDHSVESFHRQALEKNMSVVNDIKALLKVSADPDLIEIAANNLVGNAIKYGAEGGKVVISSRDLGDMVEVEIYNDGRPLAKEDIGKLFKRFSRLTNTDGRKVRGSGIGLFITKGIIEEHGGSIRVEPRENGNAFVFAIRKK